MPRVHHVKKARKAYPEFKIEKGDEYWWWKFAYRPAIKSKTYPKRQQLTQSDFYQQLYDIEDSLGALGDPADAEDIVAQVQALLDETQYSLDNMPEQLQESSILYERVEGLEAWVSDLESVDLEAEDAIQQLQEMAPEL